MKPSNQQVQMKPSNQQVQMKPSNQQVQMQPSNQQVQMKPSNQQVQMKPSNQQVQMQLDNTCPIYEEMFKTHPMFFCRSLPQGGSSALAPVIIVRDRGEPANTAECGLVVRLFDFEQIVDLILANSYDDVFGKIDLLEALLTDILGEEVADLYVVKLVAINDT